MVGLRKELRVRFDHTIDGVGQNFFSGLLEKRSSWVQPEKPTPIAEMDATDTA